VRSGGVTGIRAKSKPGRAAGGAVRTVGRQALPVAVDALATSDDVRRGDDRFACTRAAHVTILIARLYRRVRQGDKHDSV